MLQLRLSFRFPGDPLRPFVPADFIYPFLKQTTFIRVRLVCLKESAFDSCDILDMFFFSFSPFFSILFNIIF